MFKQITTACGKSSRQTNQEKTGMKRSLIYISLFFWNLGNLTKCQSVRTMVLCFLIVFMYSACKYMVSAAPMYQENKDQTFVPKTAAVSLSVSEASCYFRALGPEGRVIIRR